jgi:hypothetical protein
VRHPIEEEEYVTNYIGLTFKIKTKTDGRMNTDRSLFLIHRIRRFLATDAKKIPSYRD